MTKPEKYVLVLLKWVDSCNLFQDRWASPNELDQYDEETFCETVGWIVAENSHSYYLASSIAPEEIGSVMQIPKCAVRSHVGLNEFHPEDESITFLPG